MENTKVKSIYNKLNDNERYGIRFGLFPARIHSDMTTLNVSASDLMKYDEQFRTQKTVEATEYFHYSDFEDDHLMAQYDERTELSDE